MASLRDIRKRIKSVKSTQKITKAMKMVAAARLRRAQESAEQANPYSKAIAELLSNLSADAANLSHPLLQSKSGAKRLVVVFSSDRGLCGAFNSSLFRRMELELKDAPDTTILMIGKKANGYFARKQKTSWKPYDTFWSSFSYENAKALADALCLAFTSGEFDRIDLCYNEFVSIMSQKVNIETFLPMSAPAKTVSTSETPKEYKYEPEKAKILSELIPKALYTKFYRACLHSLASEFGARMAAMDSASRNAGDMIDNLTLNMNRVRQANITRELVEIISGAEAIN